MVFGLRVFSARQSAVDPRIDTEHIAMAEEVLTASE